MARENLNPGTIRPEPANINLSEVLPTIYPNLTRPQLEQLIADIKRTWTDRSTASREQLEVTLAAIESTAPELTREIKSKSREEITAWLNYVTAIIQVVLTLTQVFDEPPSPETITQIIINIEGTDVTNVTTVAPPPP